MHQDQNSMRGTDMIYKDCKAGKNNSFPEKTLLRRAMVHQDLYDNFIAWRKITDPTVIWRKIDVVGKNQFYIMNMKAGIHDEWCLDKGHWKLKIRY